jgi:hypothetical protein
VSRDELEEEIRHAQNSGNNNNKKVLEILLVYFLLMFGMVPVSLGTNTDV